MPRIDDDAPQAIQRPPGNRHMPFALHAGRLRHPLEGTLAPCWNSLEHYQAKMAGLPGTLDILKTASGAVQQGNTNPLTGPPYLH